jgi:hypothetical protein
MLCIPQWLDLYYNDPVKKALVKHHRIITEMDLIQNHVSLLLENSLDVKSNTCTVAWLQWSNLFLKKTKSNLFSSFFILFCIAPIERLVRNSIKNNSKNTTVEKTVTSKTV